MSIYHFHIHDGTYYRDIEGTECGNLDAARKLAVEKIADLLKLSAARFWNGDEWSMPRV